MTRIWRKFFDNPVAPKVTLKISYATKPASAESTSIRQDVTIKVTAMRSVLVDVYNVDNSRTLLTTSSSSSPILESASFTLEEIKDGKEKPLLFDIDHHIPDSCKSATHTLRTTYQYSFDDYAPRQSGVFVPSVFDCPVPSE
ncbi:hypothetical protein GCM10027289_16140 [Tsukamurella serpentis]